MGVRRAMNAVLEAANKSDRPIYTLGPLVHNRQAIEMLEAKEVKVVSSAEEVSSGMLFIRAHGITPQVRENLERTGLEVCDMTCPHVRRAQKIIERHARKGFSSIIIGDAGHAEVIGLLGHADGRGYVVGSAEEVKNLPDMEQVCVVAQTTQNARRFEGLLPLIKERFPGVEIFNTVCSATDDRQTEVRTLAGEVDAMIVVGGKHSANTVRLAEIAREEGVPTFPIETADELDPGALQNFQTVGITAGASTPHWVFRTVVGKVHHCMRSRSAWVRFFRALLTLSVHTYLYIGAGSAAMTYAALRLLDIRPRLSYLLLALMYVVSMHLLNRFTDQPAARLNDPFRMALLQRFQPFFLTAAILFALGTLTLAFPFGFYPFVLMLFSLIAGVSYSFRWIPSWLAKRIGFQTVKEIPGSKDLFVALAWSTVTVLLPSLAAQGEVKILPVVYVFIFCFIMVFIRSLVYDLKDLEGDRIVGKETFPLIMGLKAANKLVLLCFMALAVIAVADIVFPWSALRGLLLLPVVVYVGLYPYLYARRVISQGVLFEIIVDTQFIFTGLLAFCIPY
jgi:4-hydroxy-3-methylbut-2-enyl diphosphate reductase